MSLPSSAPRRVPGWAVVATFLLLVGAIGGGVRYLLQTVPPGSQPAPSPGTAAPSTASTAPEAP